VAKEEKKIRYEKSKKLKKELKKIQNSIQYNKAIEQKLLKKYEKSSYQYNRKLDEKMREIKDLIFDEEMKEMEIEEEIENLL
jgi:hypothetical protein